MRQATPFATAATILRLLLSLTADYKYMSLTSHYNYHTVKPTQLISNCRGATCGLLKLQESSATTCEGGTTTTAVPVTVDTFEELCKTVTHKSCETEDNLTNTVEEFDQEETIRKFQESLVFDTDTVEEFDQIQLKNLTRCS